MSNAIVTQSAPFGPTPQAESTMSTMPPPSAPTAPGSAGYDLDGQPYEPCPTCHSIDCVCQGSSPAPADTDETPALRRAMAVVGSEYPHGTFYGARRLLAKAIIALGEREVQTDFERRVRAAYHGRVTETTPTGLINPTPLDWTALWLSLQLPGLAMHCYRALVTRMLEHVRTLGAGGLSPEQARLWAVWRKAQSELGSTEGK